MKSKNGIRENIESRLSFVLDTHLKKHIVEALLYVAELDSLAKQHENEIQSAFYKTIIIYLASVIEAILHFCLLELNFTFYREDWSFTEVKTLHKIDENQEIIAGKRIRKQKKIKGYIDFAVLNSFCKKQAKLYKENMYKQVDQVRVLRNKIHLMKLTEWDDKLSDKNVESVAKTLLMILDIVEKKIKNSA